MSKQSYSSNAMAMKLSRFSLGNQRAMFIGATLFVALLAFELFNFDTTQFALTDLLGDVRFVGIRWATILAIAFCAIDFAGLFRLFTPAHGGEDNREVWYLMGAWLIGASMNAVMTWWAVSLTLLDHELGNEVLSRDQLLRYVPIFVAVLVWLTRILFIGAFSMTGGQLRGGSRPSPASAPRRSTPKQAVPARTASRAAAPSRMKAAPPPAQSAPRPQPAQPAPAPTAPAASAPPPPSASPTPRPSRVRQRPPIPNSGTPRPPSGLSARGRN